MTYRILIHDFAGHPFQAGLSRELAHRGHRITHSWFAADTGPKGQMQWMPGDADTLEFLPLGADISYSKTNFLRRRAGDIAYGRGLANWIERERPDIVISGNTPTEAQELVVAACKAAGIPFVYWCQDFYSIAATRLLKNKLPGVGNLIGAWYRFLERRQMQKSARVVLITESFREQTNAWGIPPERIQVVPNWGAIGEIDVLDRDTEWSKSNGLAEGTRYLYSGTLALKHNPELLAGLARDCEAEEQVVLVSAGVGAERLNSAADNGEFPRLKCIPLQPFEVFPQVLAAGDVLLGVIERDAGAFSVPSKILSYLCAGRPIVLAAPRENLAAQILTETGAGRVVEPEDVRGFVEAARGFRENPEAAAAAGRAGRAYAEEHFVLSKIGDRFEAIFTGAVHG